MASCNSWIDYLRNFIHVNYRMKKIKIGIDVGGTFTHAVAVETTSFKVIGKSCVPTTHGASEGVAKGVVDSMKMLITKAEINPEEIILIAHSTTQATNALLEGDVATVGIIGMGKGIEGRRAKSQINLKNIQLSPGKFLSTRFRFFDTAKNISENVAQKLIEELLGEGAEVIVASEAFGVDDPTNEEIVFAAATKIGVQATSASSISKLYGLKVRTLTAVINASMMPKMLETANLTEKAIQESGINAPLMVMRSDGGIMDINEMRRRPILTMLSGPAAGVAAALMYEKVSDGIFLEVGGTSTDISVIKNGKPQVKSAQIGGNRLYLRTLDVRTLGIAGGSIPRIQNNKIIDVGPRSAHIAGLQYVSFSENEKFDDIEIEKIQPLANDPKDYVAIVSKSSGNKFSITPTAASNYLGLVDEIGHGAANLEAIKNCFSSLSNILKLNAEKIAEEILKISAEKISPVIASLAREYKLDKDLIMLVGGGGGASAIVPFTAKHLNFQHKIAKDAEVISAIGAALGMIRDTIEKTIINPTDNDLIQLRTQAFDSVVKMGAQPDSVEVTIEIDTQNKKVIAVAMGSSDLRTKELSSKILSHDELLKIASASFKSKNEIALVQTNDFFFVFQQELRRKVFFGLIEENHSSLRVIDMEGTIKLQFTNALCDEAVKRSVAEKIRNMIERLTTFGDAGALVPDLYLLIGSKILDLSGLISEHQALAIVDFELSKISAEQKLILIASPKK